MKLKIFDLETEIFFNEQYVNVLEIENKTYFKNLLTRFYKVYNGIEVLEPFILIENNINELSDEFEIIQNPFNLGWLSKNLCIKFHKYLQEKIKNTEKEISIKDYIKEINSIFIDLFIDLDLNLEYNMDVNSQDLIKIFLPKIEFTDFDNTLNTYKKIVDVISRLKIFKFLIFIDVKKYLNKEDFIKLYKFVKQRNLNILIIESSLNDELLTYENKIIADNDLYERNIY